MSSFFKGYLVGVGVVFATNTIVDYIYPDIKLNRNSSPIQEALDTGISAKQLQAAFEKAAPEIVSGEVKKLADLCKVNAPLLATRGINCSKVQANFKPQGPS